MKGSVTVIVALVLIALMTTLVFYPGGFTGILLALAVGAAFPVMLFVWYRRRNQRLMKALGPDETVLANGLVSNSPTEEFPALLVRSGSGGFRLLLADERGALQITGVAPALAAGSSEYDRKQYMVLGTSGGKIRFAPYKSLNVAAQPPYALEILQHCLSTGLPSSPLISAE